MSTDDTEHVGVTCDSCDWTLTVADVVGRLEEKEYERVTPRRVREKFGSLGEGHAYFNRGHRISVGLDSDDVERALQPDTESAATKENTDQ